MCPQSRKFFGSLTEEELRAQEREMERNMTGAQRVLMTAMHELGIYGRSFKSLPRKVKVRVREIAHEIAIYIEEKNE